ncbi:MAG: hypothetical protein IV085_06155 [Thiobacillus sp.]|nr:hypothetical protein [Thiobacillus sp.]
MKERRLEDLYSEFERGVFMSAYASAQQKRRRALAMAVLVVKHALRGLLFSWPAYVLGLAAYHNGVIHAVVYLLLLVPALGLSVVILVRGVRDDYRAHVKGLLLQRGFARELIFPAAL